jgi:hypothetical protein
MKCFGCGDDGHIQPNCPNAVFDDRGRPPWCGFCDERSRLIDHGNSVSRCQQCHPLSRQQLRQHRKCPSCHMTVYDWDNAPCGEHGGPHVPDKRLPLETIRGLVSAEQEAAPEPREAA